MVTFGIFAVMVALMLLGVPVAVAMGITAVGTFILLGEGSILAMIAQRMYAATTGFTLLAIPFFILAGNLMNTGGITNRIFRFANSLIGHVKGGLGHVNILASLIFSGMSGSAVADAAGLGLIEIKAMDDAGYDRKFSAALTSASSTIGPVVPPSIPFVIYGSITNTSVGKLFLAGFIPGILMAGTMMVAVAIISKIRNYPRGKRGCSSLCICPFPGSRGVSRNTSTRFATDSLGDEYPDRSGSLYHLSSRVLWLAPDSSAYSRRGHYRTYLLECQLRGATPHHYRNSTDPWLFSGGDRRSCNHYSHLYASHCTV